MIAKKLPKIACLSFILLTTFTTHTYSIISEIIILDRQVKKFTHHNDIFFCNLEPKSIFNFGLKTRGQCFVDTRYNEEEIHGNFSSQSRIFFKVIESYNEANLFFIPINRNLGLKRITYKLDTRAPITKFIEPNSTITFFMNSEMNQEMVAVSFIDGTIAGWNLNKCIDKNKEAPEFSIITPSKIIDLKFNANGDLVTLAYDGEVAIWDIKTRHKPSIKKHFFSPIKRLDNATLSSDGNTVLYTYENNLLVMNNLNHKKSITEFNYPTPITTAAYREGTLTVALTDNNIYVTNTHQSPEKYQAILRGHREKINYIAFSNDNDQIISASDDKTIRIWSDLEVEETTDLVLEDFRPMLNDLANREPRSKL